MQNILENELRASSFVTHDSVSGMHETGLAYTRGKVEVGEVCVCVCVYGRVGEVTSSKR